MVTPPGPVIELAWQRPTFPTPRHERVHDLLGRLISEGAAHFFADACDIIQKQPPFRSTTHLVAHLIREVDSATRDVLRTLPEATSHLMENRAKGSGKTGHVADINAILRALGLHAHPVATEWSAFTGDEKGWTRAAHRDSRLHLPRSPDEMFRERFDLFVDVLSVVLDAAETKYAEVIAIVDKICEVQEPRPRDIKSLALYLAPGVAALAYAFDNLAAGWITALRDHGVFARPPEIQHRDDGSFSYPHWPQARYLRRVATDAPAEVALTIEGLPQTDNENVHLSVLEAAVRMPPAEAVRVARHELSWLGDNRWISTLIPRAVGELVVHLWRGGEHDGALTLLSTSLALIPSEKDDRWHGPDARTSAWSYGELAKATLPTIAADDLRRVLDLLLALIDDAGEQSRLLLRRRIDAGGHPGLDEPLEILFSHLREFFLKHASIGPKELRASVAELDAKDAPLYDRLALHLLRIHGQLSLDLVLERVSDPERLSAGDIDDEITLLVRDRFADLVPDDQKEVLDAIRETTTETWLRREFEERLDDAEYAPLGRHRLLKWFHQLKDHLSADDLREYETLLSDLGPPACQRQELRFGPNPPLRPAELADLDDEELTNFLKDWEPPSQDPFEPSRSGLGQALRAIVELDAPRFTSLAGQFRGLAPEYVANVVWGLGDAVKRMNEWAERPKEPGEERPEDLPEPSEITWDSVLDLLEWTAAQPTTEGEEGASGNWTGARRMAVDLAEEAFVALGDDPASALRAWRVIDVLLGDADPTTDRDAAHGSDIDTFAMNTVRGQALHAATRVASVLKRVGGNQTLLDAICVELLRRVDPSVESSVSIRCVLAMRFTRVCALGATLGKDMVGSLFGTGDEPSAGQLAAWKSFLKWNNAWPGTYKLLGNQYDAAIERLGSSDPAEEADLGEHLTWLAARGALDFEGADSRLRGFVEKARVPARLHALNDLGRAIHRTEDEIEDEVGERLRRLWQWWSDLAIARQDAGDLAAFGSWFSSKHFAASWSLPTLNQVLEATGGSIDWDHAVVERLLGVARDHPVETARALALFIHAPNEWQANRNRGTIRGILEALADTVASEAANQMASRLVARRWLDFRDLASAGTKGA